MVMDTDKDTLRQAGRSLSRQNMALGTDTKAQADNSRRVDRRTFYMYTGTKTPADRQTDRQTDRSLQTGSKADFGH